MLHDRVLVRQDAAEGERRSGGGINRSGYAGQPRGRGEGDEGVEDALERSVVLEVLAIDVGDDPDDR
jgi:hypothetical protein